MNTEIFTYNTLKRVFVGTTMVCVVSFFGLLIVANVTNRRGIKEMNELQSEIRDYQKELSDTTSHIATYSSLVRVEARAKDMKLGPAKKVEYLK